MVCVKMMHGIYINIYIYILNMLSYKEPEEHRFEAFNQSRQTQ